MGEQAKFLLFRFMGTLTNEKPRSAACNANVESAAPPLSGGYTSACSALGTARFSLSLDKNLKSWYNIIVLYMLFKKVYKYNMIKG